MASRIKLRFITRNQRKEDSDLKLLREFAIIVAIAFGGEFISYYFNLAIPGNVLGMLILFSLLLSGLLKVEQIKNIGKFLLDHLAFFFIPPAVAIISTFDILKGQWIQLTLVVILSTIMVLISTGLTIQFFQKVINRVLNNKEEILENKSDN
ncbi:CidA/LrgA family protein [Halonatronum saccharophilum]|uniref:CidA/LrgA family protein n=1 Tax=Halonatronum saccharophilum TaxID=150060 RepID=UPI001B7FC7ED|nr:CidA/LrgA family protein [Halonatronum saccharophilum]